jgi:DDE superfamily endonuclease
VTPRSEIQLFLLATVPNRFEFTFTPTHGSWLNLIESFFGKMARTLLRGFRLKSKEELKTRIEMYLREVNEEPVVFRWKYKLGNALSCLAALSIASPNEPNERSGHSGGRVSSTSKRRYRTRRYCKRQVVSALSASPQISI